MMKNRLCLCLLAVVLMVCMLAGAALADSTPAAGLTISDNSATLTIGDTKQLTIKYNGSKVTADGWMSSEPTVASVSSSGKVKAKKAGSTVITAVYNGQAVQSLISVIKQTQATTKRYNVLIIDTSGSIRGTPFQREKEAAKRFCRALLDADGENKIAVLTMDYTSKVVCSMTGSYSTLAAKIDGVAAGGDTNMTAAFRNADTILKAIPSGTNVMKNVILCSDGLPNYGEHSTSGHYNSRDHRWYQYANSTYSVDAKMKQKGYFIYALGFFHNSTGQDLTFGKQLMKDLASKDKSYIITDPDDINDVMDDIVDVITELTLSETEILIPVGGSVNLTAYLNGQSTSATWKSEDVTIASVSTTGKVTGKQVGTTKITATAGGKNATCKVTVYQLSIPSSITIYVGETKTIPLTCEGLSGTPVWTSAKTDIATVNQSGVVKGIKVGKTNVTVSVAGKTATCAVTVKARAVKTYTYKGKITNAMDGSVLSGVSLKFRMGNATTGDIYKTVKTNADGEFSTKLPAGEMTVTMSKSGFITANENITVQAKACDPDNNINYLRASLSPNVGSGNFRIVLTWGTSVRDLDSHFTGPMVDSSSRFHVYFRNKNYYAGSVQVVNLDLDDTTYEGPETTTFYYDRGAAGTYNFYVYQYSSDATPLIKSDARVTVYRGNKQLASYKIPTTGSTTARTWKVFSITNGKIKFINQLSNDHVDTLIYQENN